jgi:hypothetical protein
MVSGRHSTAHDNMADKRSHVKLTWYGMLHYHASDLQPVARVIRALALEICYSFGKQYVRPAETAEQQNSRCDVLPLTHPQTTRPVCSYGLDQPFRGRITCLATTHDSRATGASSDFHRSLRCAMLDKMMLESNIATRT